ncbi:MAG: ABC transporter substrate-binding protein [Bauldia sp.]
MVDERPKSRSGWPDRRRLLVGAAGVVVAASLPQAARAQPRRLVCAMIGAAGPDDANGMAWFNAIRLGLSEEGWVDGDGIHIEARYTAGLNSLSEQYSAELAELGPDVWLCGTPTNALNAHRLLPDVPLVFAAVPDPIGVGLVKSFNEPGGNVTGVAHFEPSIGGRQLQLLLEIAPHLKRVGYLYNPDNSDSWALMLPYVMAAADAAGVELIHLPVHTVEDVAPAVASVAALPDSGLLVPTNNWVSSNRFVLLDAVDTYRIPAMWAHSAVPDALISYHVDTTEAFHQAGRLAGHILDGVHPSDLPVLGAPRYVMTVNLGVAAALGLTVPNEIMVAADRIIE